MRWLISTLHARNKKPVPKQTRQTSQQTLDVTPVAPLGVEALWFSISKSGDKSLDRVGKAAGKDFRMITAEQIIRFLQFNMKGNTLLVAGRVLLQQGQRGVPIGEFLSAQLAEIWAAWKEFSKLFATSDDTNTFAADVTSALHQVCTCSVPSMFSDQLTERSLCMKYMGCSVLGRGAEPPQFWVLLIWLEPGISHVTWVHYDATMCLPCFVCSVLPVLHFL